MTTSLSLLSSSHSCLVLLLHSCQLATSFRLQQPTGLPRHFHQFIHTSRHASVQSKYVSASVTTKQQHGRNDGRRRRRRAWTGTSAGAVVHGDARMHALVDGGNGSHGGFGAVRDPHTLPAVLQLPRCLSEAASTFALTSTRSRIQANFHVPSSGD